MANLNLGKIVMTFNQNPYNNSTIYSFLEAVYDIATNTTYLSLQDNNTGALPVYPVIVNTYWIVLCKGIGVTTDNNFTNAYKTKLDGIENDANYYVHPTGDGNLHVPITGTTNNGKILKAGSTAGSISWSSLLDVGAALGDSSGNANNALSLGGVLASNYPQITSGTWTPGLEGYTTPGSPTYVVQGGVYYKIGKLVILDGKIQLSSKGGMAGNIKLTGFPFVTTSNANSSVGGNVTLASGFSLTTGVVACVVSGWSGANYGFIMISNGTGTWSATDANIADNLTLSFQFIYFTD